MRIRILKIKDPKACFVLKTKAKNMKNPLRPIFIEGELHLQKFGAAAPGLPTNVGLALSPIKIDSVI